MVVKTRSYYQENMCETDAAGEGTRDRRSHRRVKIMTPSFVEANTRTYKIYDPAMKTSKKNAVAAAAVMEEEDDAAEVLMSLLQQEDGGAVVHHTCLNPLSPITKFVYRICVYNIDRTLHYKTAYIIYDNKSRQFYVYTIISNRFYSNECAAAAAAADAAPEVPVEANYAEFSLPEPKNTIQTKYTCFIDDTVKNYVMTMIIPPNVFDYHIQDDIFGVVIDKNVFSEIVTGDESSFYDIETLINSKTSTETISGFSAFMLIHSRQFWYDPAASFSGFYSAETVDSVLIILSQSR